MKPNKFEITPDGWRASFTITNASGCSPYQVQMPASVANSCVLEEMAVIEAVDRLVDLGLTHPETEAILNKVTARGE